MVNGQKSRFFGLWTFDSGQPLLRNFHTCVSPKIEKNQLVAFTQKITNYDAVRDLQPILTVLTI
jgi:hypothetical protein